MKTIIILSRAELLALPFSKNDDILVKRVLQECVGGYFIGTVDINDPTMIEVCLTQPDPACLREFDPSRWPRISEAITSNYTTYLSRT